MNGNTRWWPALRRDDRGASLILVLALLMFVGLVTGSTLTYAQTSLKTSTILEDQVVEDYDVDGALQVGLNRIRNSNFISSKSSGGALDAPPGPLVVPGSGGGMDSTVTFEPVTGTGANGTAIARRTNQAVLATTTGAVGGETGVARNVSGTARVAGTLASNSTVAASSGELVADGTVRAVGGCSGTVNSLANDKNCSAGATGVPTFTQPTGSVTVRTVPACPGNGSTIQFQPGLYNDAAALSNLMNTCNASTFWFPGATGGESYFFDFRDGETGYPSGNKIWQLNNAAIRVVAGGTSAPGNPASVSIPGACTSPLTNADNKGVTFVFGGASQLKIDAGQMEVCGPGDASGGAAPIALFGGDTLVGGVGGSGQLGPNLLPPYPPTAPVNNGTLTMLAGTGQNVSPDQAFGNNTNQKDRIRLWDNSVAAASLTNTNRRASVRVSGYAPGQANPADTVPAGATLTYAKAYVRHREQESGSASFRHVHLTITPSRSGAPAVGPVNVAGTSTPGVSPTNSSTYQRGEVNLLTTTALQNEVTAHGFSGANAVWSVELGATGTENATMDLDSILIVMAWTENGGFRPQSTTDITPNCVGRPTTVYPGAGACAMVQTNGGQLYVQGTGYAARGAFDLGHTDIKAPVFASGLIARQVRLNTTNANTYNGPVVNRPRPLEMLIRGYTCPDGGCTSEPGPEFAAPWLLSGTATATYTDPGDTITSGNRAVAIDSWWVLR